MVFCRDKCKQLNTTLKALRNAFSGMTVDSGWIDSSILRWGSSSTGEWAVKFIPHQLHSIDCTDLGILRVPLTAMLFLGKGSKYWVWALKSKELDHNTPVGSRKK
ncbi:MAG: hypothetical protein NVS2B14_00700 [Chamaesiphon sp.]